MYTFLLYMYVCEIFFCTVRLRMYSWKKNIYIYRPDALAERERCIHGYRASFSEAVNWFKAIRPAVYFFSLRDSQRLWSDFFAWRESIHTNLISVPLIIGKLVYLDVCLVGGKFCFFPTFHVPLYIKLIYMTLNGGSLGSWIDEERSKVR